MRRATGLLVLLLACFSPAAAQTEAELALVRRMFEAFRGPDYAALAEMVDFPRRAAERAARGLDARPWEQLDELDRLGATQLALRGWLSSERNFDMRATFVSAEEVADPDAGLGPVPDRRILRLILRHQSSGEYRDVLLTLTREPRILDLEQGPVYAPGNNPAGEAGLQPRAVLSVAVPLEVTWDPDVDQDERDNVTGLVDALLAAQLGEEQRLARERLHRNPHVATAALLERLVDFLNDPPADAEAPPRLVDALEHITGRSSAWLAVTVPGTPDPAGDGLDPALVNDWLRWHAANGWTFSPAEVEDPIEPTIAERTEPSAPLDLDRWDQRLREQQENAAGGGAKDPPPDTPAAAEPEAPPEALPPPPPAPPPVEPPVASAPTPPRPSPRDLLFTAAADLSFHYRGRDVTGREVEGELAPSLREALNAWAETCTRLGLTVVSTGHPEHLVIGGAPRRTLEAAAEVLDGAAALLDPSVPLVEPRQPRAVVALVFDEESVRSDTWRAVLDDLVERRVLFEETAAPLRDTPAGLTRRQAPLFLQLTWDAYNPDDSEFKYDNELVGKFTQCLVTARVGELPRAVLWGLDYVVEEQLYESIYQFDTTGFVATADHFDWPVRAKQYVEKVRDKDESVAVLAAADDAAGQPMKPQMVTWAALAFLRDKHPDSLATLLEDLAAVQAAADPRQRAAEWRGDREQTLAALARTLDTVDLKELIRWLDSD